ncbi:MAG: hypothetical protein K9L02_06300 [Acholeplasmataceae bacterium]|nr:hypothetical protein [Acholeplasmataceae bacterium]
MKYTTLLPFLDREDIADVANKIIKGELKGIKLSALYPFLDDEILNTMIEFLIKEKRYKEIYSAVPFMSAEKINQLYETVENGGLEGFKTSYLIPFMSRKKIKEIFEVLVKRAENDITEDDEDDEDEDEMDLDEALEVHEND